MLVAFRNNQRFYDRRFCKPVAAAVVRRLSCLSKRPRWRAQAEALVGVVTSELVVRERENMGGLSVNIITLNEATRIRRCLASVDWADEIVVVDGGSEDGTAELAAFLGARVICHRFDNFASQRNRALTASRFEWVLCLDADEIVSPPLARAIRRALCDPGTIAGYWIPIHSWIFGRRFRFSGTEGERKLRLFRRDCAYWTGAVHEVPVVRGRLGVLNAPVLHFSTPDVDVFVEKMRRYCGLAKDRRGPAARYAAAALMFARRWLRHLGMLDGPEGLAFALLSAWEEWHRTGSSGVTDVSTDDLLLRIARCLTNSGGRRGPVARIGPCPQWSRLACEVA